MNRYEKYGNHGDDYMENSARVHSATLRPVQFD